MSHIHAFAYKDLPQGIDANKVWSHLIDIDLRPKLIKRIQSIERMDDSKAGSPLRVGSKYYEKAGDTTAPGRSYKAEVTVTEMSGGGSVHRGTKSASACTSDLDTCSNDGDDEDKDECGTRSSASANAKESLPFPRFSDDYDSNAVHDTLRDQIYLSKEDPEAQLDSMHARLEQLQLEKLKRASKLKSKRSSSLLTKETVIA